jgi:chromosome partitioning protein
VLNVAKLDYEKLREKRVEIDITQKELARRSGVNVNIIKSVETGRTKTDKENLKKLANALEIEIESFYIDNFKETNVISILNNKGGSGKTSVCGSLAYALSEQNYKILLIDADMQQNLTHSYNLEDNEKNLADAIIKEESLLNYILKSKYDNIDFVIADLKLSTIDMVLFTKIQRENIIKQILKPVVEKGIYDYILIDTNPTLAILNFNVVNASDYVLIPVELSSFGLEGLDVLINFIKGVQKINENVELAGIVVNKYDMRKKNIVSKSEEILKEAYGNIVLKTIIRVDTNIENAQMNNVPVLTFNTNSRIAKEFRDLAKEVIKIAKQ